MIQAAQLEERDNIAPHPLTEIGDAWRDDGGDLRISGTLGSVVVFLNHATGCMIDLISRRLMADVRHIVCADIMDAGELQYWHVLQEVEVDLHQLLHLLEEAEHLSAAQAVDLARS